MIWGRDKPIVRVPRAQRGRSTLAGSPRTFRLTDQAFSANEARLEADMKAGLDTLGHRRPCGPISYAARNAFHLAIACPARYVCLNSPISWEFPARSVGK